MLKNKIETLIKKYATRIEELSTIVKTTLDKSDRYVALGKIASYNAVLEDLKEAINQKTETKSEAESEE